MPHKAVTQHEGADLRWSVQSYGEKIPKPAGDVHAEKPDEQRTVCDDFDTTDWRVWDFEFEGYMGQRCRKCKRLVLET